MKLRNKKTGEVAGLSMYIEDYNKHSLDGNTLFLDDFKASLNADCVVICWE